MDTLNKVAFRQIYNLWRNVVLSFVFIIAIIILCKYLPVYLSPIISFIFASILYTIIKYIEKRDDDSCPIILYSTFISLLLYSITLICLNLIYAINGFSLINEILFFDRPFKPILVYAPIALIVNIFFYIRKTKLSICIRCKLNNGDSFERGIWGATQKAESYIQLRNLILIYAIISLTIFIYYNVLYVDININNRDSFIFVWLTIIVLIIDIFYFLIRYYNLYLDLKESNHILLPEEINNKNELLFLRYYLICGNYIYLSSNNYKNLNQGKLDTPFFIKSNSPKITLEESTNIIKDLSGIENGEIRFFYGRKSQRPRRNKMFRYFYFLNGDRNDYKINKNGKWFNYDEIKEIYSSEPDKLSNILIADTTRIARILITEKVYDSYGNRKIALDNYVPTYDLYDLYNSDIDFQDDKWIRISLFNSDSKFYKIRKLFRQIFRNRQNRNTPPTSHEA